MVSCGEWWLDVDEAVGGIRRIRASLADTRESSRFDWIGRVRRILLIRVSLLMRMPADSFMETNLLLEVDLSGMMQRRLFAGLYH